MRVGESARRRAFLERRVEGDLRILLVEDILAPEFDAPFFVGTTNADTGVKDGIAVLCLLREQVGTGVVVAGQTGIDVEEAGEATLCVGGGMGIATIIERL